VSPSIRDQIESTVEPPSEAYEGEEEAVIQEANEVIESAGLDGDQPEGWVAILQADTPKEEVHQRAALARGGSPVVVNGQPLVLDYVTARFVQDRLDAAVGPANWQSHFESLVDGSVRCGIGIRIPGTDSNEWVWKWDVGVASTIEPQKGAHSDAFKRAGVQWGIARDLYDDRDEKAMNVALPQNQAPAVQGAPTIQYTDESSQQPAVMPRGADGQGVAAWVCPIHNDTKIVPAGTSKKPPYRPYSAFYACPIPGCDQTGPKA
jgi:hypothetical protein